MEQHASALTSRLVRNPGVRRFVQALVCLGAVAAAGALAVETRVGARSGAPTAASIAAPTAMAADTEAQAKAHQALAKALARAKTLGSLSAPLLRPSIDAPQTAGESTATAAESSTIAQSPPLSAAALQLLADKAAQALETGDIAGARLVLQRAAGSGDATAVFALAETFDPNVLAKMRVRGLTGNIARARELYREAEQKGVARAKDRLNDLAEADTASAN